ncbi:hypothetical protein [Chitinophaga pinensis]|uniref:Nuclear transport factor 2 family protein n=1 Tax=Chitinophaga pinensis TaxID=79329 RepID=A0A5C6LKK3_9BACT|nr:hypothetical protein [Chitinophaga pinensis]TWV96191.1 hypothetical protein FEF09_23675 [Chitinophaga pinensis]
MKTFLSIIVFVTFALTTFAQTTSKTMNTDKLTNTTVRKAIDALQSADSKAWFALFTADAALYDDGNKMNFRSFFEKTFGHERFTSIDKVENNGLDLYGHFHSDQWGDFKTYFKFHINSDGKINRLDIGQASY